MGQIFIKSTDFLNIQDCIVTVYVVYKKRRLRLPSELKFVNFFDFTGGEVERLRCSQANSSLNPSIIFVIKACIFTISIPITREACVYLLSGELLISLIIVKERVKV